MSGVGVMVTTHLFGFGEELELSTACFLQRLSSPLHTHPHFSNFQSLAHKSVCDLTFNLSFFDIYFYAYTVITHACLKACPFAFVNEVLNLCL